MQSQGGQGTIPVCGPLLAQQELVLKAWAPGIGPSLANSFEEGLTLPGKGTIWNPLPDIWNLWSLDAKRRISETFHPLR